MLMQLLEPFIHAFDIGFYESHILICHLPLVLIGFYIRLELCSSGTRWLWFAALLLSAFGCFYFWNDIAGYERIGICFAAVGVLDFAAGTLVVAIPDNIYMCIAAIIRRRKRRKIHAMNLEKFNNAAPLTEEPQQ